jgi:pyruvate dehydrogenase phosphatase
MAWAVFDGHAGWKSAEFLKNQRLPFMQYSLMKVKSGSIGKPIPEELFRQAIIQGFVNLDDSIIKTALDTSQGNEPLRTKRRN